VIVFIYFDGESSLLEEKEKIKKKKKEENFCSEIPFYWKSTEQLKNYFDMTF